MLHYADAGHGRGGSRRRERLAVITPWHPEPVDNGSKQRLRQILAALAESHDIVLISLLPPQQRGGGSPPRVPGVWRQHTCPLPAFNPHSARALIAALHPFPRSFAATWDRAVAATIRMVIEQAGVSLAIGADLRVLRYLLALPTTIPTILDEVNTSPFIVAAGQGCGLARWRAVSRERKFARMLRAAAQRLATVIVASPREAHAYRHLAGPARVEVIENGVGALPEPAWRAPAGAQLLYAGSLTYGANAEAVAHFAKAILPQIEREVPAVRLLVTGEAPEVIPPDCRHPRVVPTGWLTREALEAAYRGSRACTVPLRSGTGTRIKLLEAMAFGIPVVSTAKGAEGLGIVPDEDYLRADTPADFAAATTRLLRDAAFAEALGARGRGRIRRDYTWDVRGQQFRDLVGECLAGRKEGVCPARRA